MKQKYFIIILVSATAISAQQVPKWTLELDDQIEGYNFLKDAISFSAKRC